MRDLSPQPDVVDPELTATQGELARLKALAQNRMANGGIPALRRRRPRPDFCPSCGGDLRAEGDADGPAHP